MAGGQKILDGLRDAVAGNLAVTVIDGVVWVRKDLSRIAELEAALREIADTWCPDSRDEYELRGQDMRSSARMQSIARAALTKSETR